MTTGGTLALQGDNHDLLSSFLRLINGGELVRYWDYSISDWANISGATYGEDYTLAYLTEGDLAGYTLLTVGTPEPSISGDANCDGVVDGGDAAVMARYWQTERGAVWGMGDFNGDNAVDDLDAAILAANWGNNGPDAAVPEPSVLAGLLALAAAGFLAASRRAMC